MLEALKKMISILFLVVPRLLKRNDERRRDEVRKALAEGDKEKVNQAFGRLLKVFVASTLLSSALFGCHTYTVVASDEEILPMEQNGVEGWFVPTSVMLKIYDKLNESEGK